MVSMDATPHLLDPAVLAELGPAEAVRLPLDLIDPSPRNPRVGELPEIEALAESIRDFGVLQPVLVRRNGERFELVAGHRRYAAVRLLHEIEPYEDRWRTLPAVIRTASDDDAELMLITAQVHSQQWRPIEEASMLERLYLSLRNMEAVGRTLHKDQTWVSRRLRIYNDSTLSGFVQAGNLPRAVAEELLVLKDSGVKREYAERAVSEGWSQSQARREVRKVAINKAVAEVAREARRLLDLLSQVEPTQIPDSAAKDLLRLSRRINQLAKSGGRPVIPTIEQAQHAAGINPNRVPRKIAVRKRRT